MKISTDLVKELRDQSGAGVMDCRNALNDVEGDREKALQILKEKGAEDIIVFGGGIIPVDDIAGLKKEGIREIFQPGASTEDIIKYIQEKVKTT